MHSKMMSLADSVDQCQTSMQGLIAGGKIAGTDRPEDRCCKEHCCHEVCRHKASLVCFG